MLFTITEMLAMYPTRERKTIIREKGMLELHLYRLEFMILKF